MELIQRNLPHDLKDRALSERRLIEGERRQVTVLFCDLAGFTGLTEEMGPEDAYSMMEEVYEILIRKVYDFEGTVNELTGDGILALFGAPIAVENAPERAIRAAFAIHRGLAVFNEDRRDRKPGLRPLRMRIGINTGPVVVGSLGNDLRVEFKAVGDTVNLASRLENLADPGSTLVSEATFKLTEGIFRFESLGERPVKGKEHPVRTYRVIAPGSSRTRFDVSAERGLTPHVGRDREIEILFDSYRRSREGRGQVVSIIAEAGLGKSRLLYEFRKTVASEVVTVAEGRCLAYNRNTTYHPLIDLLRTSFGLTEDADEETITAVLGLALDELGVDGSVTIPWLVELLVGSSHPEMPSYTPEARKAQLIRVLTGLILAWSEFRPLIMAIEDLHWIDPSTEELLSHLLGAISGSRILILLTYRPQYPPPWQARSYQSQLTLNRLSNRETLAMARHRLGGADLDEAFEGLILEKTEGVPFFVEEFLSSMDDLGLIDVTNGLCALKADLEQVSIPSTIQDVLRARVDVLPESARDLLRTASVLGRETSHSLLRLLAGGDEQSLLSDLSVLRDSELVYERGIYPHSTYIFKHALTQEVVHDSLLEGRRRELHRRAGEAIEDLYRGNLSQYQGILVEHFIAGGDYEKASRYARQAASSARHAGAIPMAIEFAEKNVWCVGQSHRGHDSPNDEIEARAMLAGYILITGDPHKAAKAVTPIKDEASEHAAWPAVFTALGLHELFAKEDISAAKPHLAKVLDTSLEDAHGVWQWFAHYYLGGFLAWRCAFDEGIRHLQACDAISERAGNQASAAVAKGGLGHILIFQGRLAEASNVLDRTLSQAAASQDPTSEALTQAVIGVLRCAEGSFTTAKPHLQAGMDSTGVMGQGFWRSFDMTFLGDSFLATGDLELARNTYQESLEILVDLGSLPSWQNLSRLKLARVDALRGEATPDLSQLEAWRRATRMSTFEGLTARLIAQTLQAKGTADSADVRRWVEVAFEADTRNGLNLDLAHDHVLMADLHERLGATTQVIEHLRQARPLFQRCAATAFVEQVDERLKSADRGP